MNYFVSRKNWQLTLAVTVVLISGVTALQAQDSGRDNRPAAVPQEYFATPMGYFHPSCVQELADGDILRKDEMAIEHQDGSFDSVPTCGFPHYTAAGEKIPMDDADAEPPAGTAYAYITEATMKKDPASSYYGELKATWIVPPDPATHGKQLLYFFPGLQDYKTNLAHLTILQPVMGWNVVSKPLHLNYPNVWTLSSWNCCVNGTVQHSPFITTEAGHTIFGVMVCTTPGAPRCGSFNVNTFDQTTGKTTELRQTSSFGQYFNWAFAGALEVYNVSQCSEYPGGSKGSIEFYYLGLYDNELQPVDQDWQPTRGWTGLTPQCSYGISVGETKGGLPAVTLKY
jgi:hypothetical protein